MADAGSWAARTLAGAESGVIVRDADGEILACNDRACELLGLTREELTGRSALDPRWRALRLGGAPLPAEDFPSMVALRTGRPLHNVLVGVVRPRGGRAWLSFTSLPGPDGGGVMSLFDDVSALVFGRETERSSLAIATELAAMPPGGLSDVIGPCLDEVLAVLDASTAALWTIDHDRGVLQVVQRRQAVDEEVRVAPWDSTPIDVVSWLLASLSRDGTIVVTEGDDLPAAAAPIRARLQEQAMATAVFAPLLVRGRLDGLVSVSFTRVVELVEPLVDFVGLVAGLLGQAYARERALGELRQLNATLDQRVQERSQALRREQDRLRAVLDALPDLLIELDGNDTITAARVPAVGWDFVRGADLTGHPVLSVVPAELTTLAGRRLASVRRTAQMATFEFAVPIGERSRTFETRLVPVGSAGEVLALVRDVTQEAGQAENLRELSALLARLTGELMAAARARDEVLVGVGHELRTPLSDVVLACDLLVGGDFGPLDEEQRGAVETIRARAGHLLHVVDDLLDVEAEASRPLVEVQPVPLAGVVAEVAARIAPAARDAGLRLIPRAPVGGLEVETDRHRLVLVLDNLLENAVQFTDPGGTIGIEVLPPARGEVRLAVWDTGIGIAPEDHPRLFAPFVRLDPERARRYDGTGLGLALVERAAGVLGGRVELDSAPGRGSRFTVVLPCREQGAAHPGWPQGWLGHVVTPAQYEDALAAGRLAPGPAGFVHLSSPHQLAGTVGRFFADVADPLVIVVDPAGWEELVRWEEGEPGQWFPHAYGEVPWTAVLAVMPWEDLAPELGVAGAGGLPAAAWANAQPDDALGSAGVER